MQAQWNPAPVAEKRAPITRQGWTLFKHYVLIPALDLVFPPVCVGCSRVGALLCEPCIKTFHIPAAMMVPPAPLSALQALGTFEGALQQAVHALKYDRVTGMASVLGALMAQTVMQAGWPPSIIVPIPLHEARARQRGFNQSALLAATVAEQLGWPLQTELLARTRDTASQVGLSREQRQDNVRGAFAVLELAKLPRRQPILIVDDVFTTGATMKECAATLLASGAAEVRALVAGRAVFSGVS